MAEQVDRSEAQQNRNHRIANYSTEQSSQTSARPAPPEIAEALYERFISLARDRGVRVETGRFGAHMELALVNDGPVTIILDSRMR